MTLRKILHYPHPNLRLVAKPVTEFNADLKQLVADMFETMYADDGIGLAATQIDVQQRVVTIDLRRENISTPIVLINPEIVQTEGSQEGSEGCLSVPGGIYEKVKRSETITAKFFNEQGEAQVITTAGLLSVCIQHEIDHLNGVLFIDHLSRLKREMADKKIKKFQKANL